MIDKATILRQANELKRKIHKDIISSYQSLLDFSERHSPPDSDAKIETILLGSHLHESLEQGEQYKLDKEKAAELKTKAEELVDIIAHEAQFTVFPENVLHEQVRKHFLDQRPPEQLVFEADKVGKHYPNGAFRLSNISIALRLGEITGLVGENGSGKTTLLKIIAGEESQSEGKLRYPLFSNNWPLVKQSIAYIPQNFGPPNSRHTVKEHLHFTGAIKGIRGPENVKLVNYMLNRFNLKSYQNRRWSQLSGGYKLRFELARQLMWKPKLVVLDEPLASLDIRAQSQVLGDLRNMVSSVSCSMALILSSQSLFEVEKISDNIIYIENGKTVFNGSITQIGRTSGYKSFEIDTDCSTLHLQQVLYDFPIKNIQHNGRYTIIVAHDEVSANALLNKLIEANVAIHFFRNVSYSTDLPME